MDTQEHARWNALAAERLEGWRWVKLTAKGLALRHPGDAECRWFIPADFHTNDEFQDATVEPGNCEIVMGGCGGIPPYATDLNAVARLEALVIARGLRLELYRALFDIVGCSVGVVYANAAQRLEAVLRCCGLLKGE